MRASRCLLSLSVESSCNIESDDLWTHLFENCTFIKNTSLCYKLGKQHPVIYYGCLSYLQSASLELYN